MGIREALLVLLFGLGRALTRLMLVNRHLRLDLKPYQAIGVIDWATAMPTRKLKTVFGEIVYGRAHFMPVGGGTGFHPLDVALGTNPGRILAMGGAVRDAVGHADELCGQSHDLQGGTGMVALDRGD